MLYPIENGRWMAPSTDEEGLLEFARNLRSPALFEAIRNGTPGSPIHGYRQTANHRRHYETIPRWPEGFRLTGDAACTVHGQGMTVAAQAAAQLDKRLRAHPGTLGRAAQAAVAQRGAPADRHRGGPAIPATGRPSACSRTQAAAADHGRPAARLANWYLDRTSDVANRDGYVARVLADVLYLLTPPAALFRPGVAIRVLRGRRGPALAAPPAPAAP